MNLPELGIGVAYFAGLEPLLGPGSLADVIEVEPQTLWLQPDAAASAYRVDAQALARVCGLPGAKIMHGIGFAVGGTLAPEPAQFPPLLEMQAALGAPWMSEHLAFNRARQGGREYTTSFMLPPRQSTAGIDAAVRSIREMAKELPVPFAFETGVNYLRPRSDEIPDGEFTARIAEAADCGILLDLHNIWCNERNGRQPVEDFLRALPLERVWEVHLAGGFERRGYYLDSHSGAIPPPLAELAARVLPRLPNLRALIFELFPSYLPKVGLGTVRGELERLHRLWDRRRPSHTQQGSEKRQIADTVSSSGPVPEDWEDTLGALVVGRSAENELADALLADPGVPIVRELLEEFRASMTVEVCKLTFRLIVLSRGEAAFDALLAGYWAREMPQRFASAEATGFMEYIVTQALDVPYLGEVLAFERATLATLLDGEARVVPFAHDPMSVLRPLSEGRLPKDPKPGTYEVELTPLGAADS